MPELPEVEFTARQLRASVVGATINEAQVFWERTIGHPGLPEFLAGVAGRSIIAIRRRGKLLVLDLSGDLILTIHRRMSGNLLLLPPGWDIDTSLREQDPVAWNTRGPTFYHANEAALNDHSLDAHDEKLLRYCRVCFNLADGPRCRTCSDERRDPAAICVVEEPSDVISIERTHEFSGRYHVLGGALSPIDGIDPDDLRIAELLDRCRDGTVREVVVATNPTTTGEATALHIAAELRQIAPELSVTRLASGLPVGADLEYADELTLGRALAGRRSL